MAQGRMLSKKISFDEKVAGLSLEATLLYTWCIPHLDCEGRIYAGAEILKGSVVPFIKELTIQKIAKCVEELAQSGLVLHYGNGHKYLQFNGFENNQNIRKDREAPSVIPSPEQVGSNSGVNPGQIKVNQIKVNKDRFLDFVLLTKEEHQKLCSEFTKEGADERIKKLNLYIGSKGDKYKSHYHTILNWEHKDNPKSERKMNSL